MDGTNNKTEFSTPSTLIVPTPLSKPSDYNMVSSKTPEKQFDTKKKKEKIKFYLDGKEIPEPDIKQLNSNTIEKMEVFSKKNTGKKYDEVYITSKKK